MSSNKKSRQSRTKSHYVRFVTPKTRDALATSSGNGGNKAPRAQPSRIDAVPGSTFTPKQQLEAFPSMIDASVSEKSLSEVCTAVCADGLRELFGPVPPQVCHLQCLLAVLVQLFVC